MRSLINVSWPGIFYRALFAVIVALIGCGGGSDGSDRPPPAGQGSIFVNNATAETLEVFVDGRLVLRIDDGDDDFIDISPGEYRVTIAEVGGDEATFIEEVDVIANRVTTFEVTQGGPGALNVEVRIENP